MFGCRPQRSLTAIYQPPVTITPTQPSIQPVDKPDPLVKRHQAHTLHLTCSQLRPIRINQSLTYFHSTTKLSALFETPATSICRRQAAVLFSQWAISKFRHQAARRTATLLTPCRHFVTELEVSHSERLHLKTERR